MTTATTHQDLIARVGRAVEEVNEEIQKLRAPPTSPGTSSVVFKGYATAERLWRLLGELLGQVAPPQQNFYVTQVAALLQQEIDPARTGCVLHRYFERGRSGADGRIAAFHFRSLDNPFLNAEYVNAQRAELTEQQWRVEWEGEWGDAENTLFRWADVLHCAQLEPGASTGARHVIGYDPAKLRDGSGVALLDYSTTPRRVIRLLDLGGRDYKLQIDRVAQLSKEYGNARVIVDATGGGNVIVDLLRAAAVPVEGITWTASRKAEMLTALAAAVERHELLFPPDPAFLRELRWFEMKRGPSGSVKYEAAAGQKDDLVSAVALALAGAGGVAKRETFAALGLLPFLRSNDRLGFDADGRPAITPSLDDGFPEGSWTAWLR